MPRNVFVYMAGLLLSVTVTAQSLPSAEGFRRSVWVGAAFSTMNPDYGCTSNSPFSCWDHQLMGITTHADVNQLLFHRLGVEGEAKFMPWSGPGLTESSYMAGPRVRFLSYKSIMFSGKFLLGMGRIELQSPATGSGNYFAYAPGATVDFRLAKRLYGRFDYEYQMWPSFKSIQTGVGHGGLTPNGFSLGVSYAILR